MPYAQKFDADLILNTTCAIELVYTGAALKVLQTLPCQVYFPKCIYDDYDALSKKQKNKTLQSSLYKEILSLIDNELLNLVELETQEEWSDFYRLTNDHRLPKQRVGATIHILAKYRKFIVVCNDTRTTNLLDAEKPPGTFVSTIDLIKYWADETEALPSSITQILSKLYETHYAPSHNHHLHAWWNRLTKTLSEY
jgi:hypothetical protein